MRSAFLTFLLISNHLLQAQINTNLVARINVVTQVPSGLLASKSIVLHSSMSPSDLQTAQEGFQRLGIDAVAYYNLDLITAGKDVSQAFSNYFLSRSINHLIFFDRWDEQYRITITTFNGEASFVNDHQAGWQVRDNNLRNLLQNLFIEVNSSQKRENFLINDIPERGEIPQVITGRRYDFFALDLKIDNLAVPQFGNAAMDADLEAYFNANYSLKYSLTEADADESQLRSQGFTYVLCFVRARGNNAKELLDYPISKTENAITSVTYPNGQLQLKTISADIPVYKFYFRHISTGNVYLGTKWDADIRWQDALNNHIQGLKAELNIR